MKPALKVILSIDVEEEGLFGGAYARDAVSVRNVAWLEQLAPLLRRVDMPVTLLCTHSVFADADACRALDALRAQCRVEVGAHLHHWNTPPLTSVSPQSGGDRGYCSAGSVPEDIMRAKLHTLFTAGRAFAGHALTSFRMGRWDLHRAHWPMLAECGVRVDASVRPLHCGRGGPDHFAAPAHPYAVYVHDREMLEVPLSCIPLLPCLPGILRNSGIEYLRGTVQKWGALSVLPVYHPLWAMRGITRRMLAAGCNILSLTWHSSEMMPGGAPHMPDMAAVQGLLGKIENYLLWLRRHWPVQGVTLSDMGQEGNRWPRGIAAGVGVHDWTY